MAKPEIAIAPTPCPMKILSTILYKEAAVMAMMAGMAYCISSCPTGFVPSSSVACLLSIEPSSFTLQMYKIYSSSPSSRQIL